MRTNGRPNSAHAIFEDSAVAAVLGFILLFAIALTYYAHVAREDVPQWGEQSEREWDAEVGGALLRIGRGATSGIGTDAVVAGVLPATPEPRALDVPFVRRVEPLTATGVLAFAPHCGGFVAEHTAGSQAIVDLTVPATGCLRFDALAPYGDDFGYDVELGGIVRVQGTRAVVLSGPPLELSDMATYHRASLTLMRLTGPSGTASMGPTVVPVDLVPGPSTLDGSADPNASNATWTFTSPHPEAWAEWFENQIRAARFSPASFACVHDAARPSCAGLGINEVRVVLDGPTAGGTTDDLALSLSYAQYAVRVG